jgi:hypothetical protein
VSQEQKVVPLVLKNDVTGQATRLLPLLLFLALPAVVQAQFTCTTNNGTITITKYTGAGRVVSIPDTITGLPVTSIGDFAFSTCHSLTNVTIPNGVTNIGHYAFFGCTSLTSIIIPDSVTSLGHWAFDSCTRLASVTLGNRLASIGNGAFNYCASLSSLAIPNSVTNLGSIAFGYCNGLNGVYFKGNAPAVGLSVFDNANNATVYYLPGTTGWGMTFGGRPTALWKPQVQSSGGS